MNFMTPGRLAALVVAGAIRSAPCARADEPARDGTGAAEAKAAAWREDFRAWNRDWDIRGVPGTRKAAFEVGPSSAPAGDAPARPVLRMTSDRASAALLIPVKGVDLKKTPIMRWRWRAPKLPEGADGRRPDKDDQAIGIYLGARAGFLKQNSIAYRWETLTPAGAEGTATYGVGRVRVAWFSLRSAEDGEGASFEESRNVAEDFQRIYGEVPGEFALSISCNSQNTGTRAEAELEWIEFMPAPPPPAPDGRPT